MAYTAVTEAKPNGELAFPPLTELAAGEHLKQTDCVSTITEGASFCSIPSSQAF